MSTDLEKYLNEYRDKLDVESPDDQAIWEGVRNGISSKQITNNHGGRKLILVRLRNIAAIALIALLTGYVLNDVLRDQIFNKSVSLAKIDKDLGQREKDYQTLVSYKQKEIGSFSDIHNLIISELIEELSRLDTIYNIAMNDLKEMGLNDQLINTIFDTYEKKIHLLELIIFETNKTENNENKEALTL